MGDAWGTSLKQATAGQNLNAGATNDFWSKLSGTGAMGTEAAMGRALAEFGRSPSSLYGEYASAVPGMISGAQSVADAATSPFATSARTLAGQQSEAARRSIEQRLSASGLGNFGSGAALRSIAEGTATPLTEAETAIASQYGNAFQNAYNTTASQTLQNLLNRGGQYGNIAQMLLGASAGAAAPEWIAPQYMQQEGWASQLLGGLAGGLGNVATGFAGSEAGSNALAKLLGL
jgi:hypothetical protein